MAILIAAPNRDTQAVQQHLLELDPQLDVRIWPELGNLDDIDFAVLWQHPPGLLQQLPALKAISSYGAGVESILADPGLPAHLPIGRISGQRLAADMAEFVAAVVINQHRGLWGFLADQQQCRWNQWAPIATPSIGILGAGKMAQACVHVFRALNYEVHCWSRSGSGELDCHYHTGADGLHEVAQVVDYLICLLPLTPQTTGILNQTLFAQMKTGAYLINVGRGQHLIEEDLIPALDKGQLSGAYLDVFVEEPLPRSHPFWHHNKIRISPHCASFTLPLEAATLMLESYRRVQRGEPPLDEISRQAGY